MARIASHRSTGFRGWHLYYTPLESRVKVSVRRGGVLTSENFYVYAPGGGKSELRGTEER